VTLPWVPEFEPAPAKEGRAFLVNVAKAGAGLERLAMTGLFEGGRQSTERLPLAPALVTLALVLLVAEVFVRRFFAGPKVKRPRPMAPVVASEAAAPVMTAPATAAPPGESPKPPASEPAKDPLAAARDRARRRTER
jgi:hypothetical protein